VAIIPFTDLLGGNATFSLIGSAGAYLAALAIMPAMARIFLGGGVLLVWIGFQAERRGDRGKRAGSDQ